MKIKVTTDNFGHAEDMPERLASYLRDNNLDEYFEVADAKREYWQNDYATLILKMKKWGDRPSITFDHGMLLGLLPWEFRADEFNQMIEDYEKYYRIRWD